MKKQCLHKLLYALFALSIIISLFKCSQNKNTSVEYYRNKWNVRIPRIRPAPAPAPAIDTPTPAPAPAPASNPTYYHPSVTFDYEKAKTYNLGLFNSIYIQRLLDKIDTLRGIINTQDKVRILNKGVLALAYRVQNVVDENPNKSLENEVRYNLDLTQHYFNTYIRYPIERNNLNEIQVENMLRRNGLNANQYDQISIFRYTPI